MLQAAVFLYRQGVDQERAFGLLDQASALAERSGSATLIQGARMGRAAVRMHDGAYSAALAIVEDPDVRPFTTAQGTRVGALALLGRHREALDVLATIDGRQRRRSEWLWSMLEVVIRSALADPDVRNRAVQVHREILAEQRTPVMVRNVAANLVVILLNLDQRERSRRLAAHVRGVVTMPGLTWMFRDGLRSLGLPDPLQGRDDDPPHLAPLAALVEDTLRWLEATAPSAASGGQR